MRWGLSGLYLIVSVFAVPLLLVRYLRTGKPVAAAWTRCTGRILRPPARGSVWIHAVSVGEVLQARPLIDAIRDRDGSQPIVLSTSTASGLAVARERYADCHVVPMPFDFCWAMSSAFERIAPREVVLIELELWPNLLAEARRRHVDVSVVSGRLSVNSFRGYRRLRRLVAPMVRSLSSIGTQTETYRERFLALGADPDRVRVTGSLKHDNQSMTVPQVVVSGIRDHFAIGPDATLIVAGSTHAPEETNLLDAYTELRKRFSSVRLVIVPRHPERFDTVAGMIAASGHTVARRSQPATSDATSVGLLDSLGELAGCYHAAEIAFVGGSLTRRGGQNMLEAAAAGAATVFGPSVWNFPIESSSLVEAEAAVQIKQPSELTAALATLVADASRRDEIAAAGQRVATSLAGCRDLEADRIMRTDPQTRRAA